MEKISFSKIVISLAGLVVVGTLTVLSSIFNSQFTDGGVDVRNTKCEELSSARQAISIELETRKLSVEETFKKDKDEVSDAYWTKNQQLEKQYHTCISKALTADPCKAPFEEITRLYEEIMADFANDKGFNEAKFNEREEAKKEYNKCVEDTRKPEFYKDKELACNAELTSGREANQVDRNLKEAKVKVKYEESLARIQNAYEQKVAILDAIEKKCNEPGSKTAVNIGAITTTGTGTAIQTSSSICTGIFAGNNPVLQRQLASLESQLQKAKAAGQSSGLSGTDHLQEAVDRVRQELRDSKRTCKIDADCGNPQPVCCSGTQVGRAFCDNGICASEKKDCTDPEICAGKPAACIAPSAGAQQQSGVYITRTIPETGACSQNLQTLNLQQATPDSNRYSITGNIPNWLNIDKPSGALPGNANVTYSCGTVQGFGPGVYTAGGSITVYNNRNELINTIPFNVSITVTGVEKMIDAINVNGKIIPLSQVHRSTGPECDKDEHWHANNGSAKALDGTVLPDSTDCGFGKTKNVPVISVPATKIEVRGLEGLKSR